MIMTTTLMKKNEAVDLVSPKLQSQALDLVILDLMLPDMDGLQVCQRARAMARYVPIIIISARGSETQRIVGLELGADDYLAKPFSMPELVARVRALLRRGHGA